jgi:hypothetical protein
LNQTLEKHYCLSHLAWCYRYQTWRPPWCALSPLSKLSVCGLGKLLHG